ncbi:MAG: sulfotransferase, partial [bacterium]
MTSSRRKHSNLHNEMVTAPEFLIVGTPRSGTTLVQRLACELSAVVVPPETHFFSDFYPRLKRRHSFPLDEASLRQALGSYLKMKTSLGLKLEVDDVVATLDGWCRSPLDLYGAITLRLAGGAELVGEKTPDHLRWWQPLATSLPHLRIVAVTRDPRGVVASRIQAGWG